MRFEPVANGLQFPEGPIAMSDGSVLVVELRRGVLTRIAADGRKDVVAETGGGPNGAAIGPDGAVYVANNGGLTWRARGDLHLPGAPPVDHAGGSIQRVELRTGEVTPLYEACEGQRLIAPNDLVFDAEGGFWFTDHGREVENGRTFGALYYARADGSAIRRAKSNLLSPNGVGLSPDGHIVYVADTMLGRLWAFDIEAPGRLKPSSPGPGRVVCTLPGYQLFDSLAVEADGRVCVATLVNGGISVVSLDGSVVHVPAPDFATTNICFGGADLCDAWITCSSTGTLYRTRWPRPGLKLAFSA
jgi:gluconolactonase